MSAPGPVSAILFDLDGTLIDSAPDLGAAADKMRTDRGLSSLPLSHYRHMAGAGARGMLSLAFGMGPEHAEYERYREEFFVNYESAMTVHTRVFDGGPEVIAAIVSAGLPWGVVTNKSRRFTEPLTAAIDVFGTASVIISGDTTAHAKPHPAPLLEAARRLQIDPALCVYVGDDERDILAGHAAGMATVAARYGYLGEQSDVARWNAHMQIDTPAHLLQRLKIQGPWL